MSKGTVYLAGKMTGLSLEEMSGWRDEAKVELKMAGFDVFNPVEVFEVEIKADINPSAREIVDSNKFQIKNSGLLLVELNHENISIGTIGEIIYARSLEKPVIAWGRADKIINHPWIQENITIAYDYLNDAIDCIIEKYGSVG